MMSIKTWSSISVYDFFRTYNWTGENIKLEPLNSFEKHQKVDSLLALKLGKFLIQGNWTGKISSSSLKNSLERSQKSLLSLSVTDFFQEMSWNSLPVIAPMPKKSSGLNSIDLPSSDLDLNNLSDLF